MLPSIDVQYLADRAIEHIVTVEANLTCVVFGKFALPIGFDQTYSDLLIRLSAGYPDVPPDMWWFDPPVQRPDGRRIPATESMEQHLGRTWQRWSRHLVPGQWRSGADGLENYLAIIREDLVKAAGASVA